VCLPQPGHDRTAAVGVELFDSVQRRPQRTGELVAAVVFGDAEQHHRDLVGRPAAHPRDQGPDLGVVLPQARVVEAGGQHEAQDRGPALLVRAGREPPVDLGLGRGARRLESLVLGPHGLPELRPLTFQEVDEPADTVECGGPHVVEEVVPAGFGHQGFVQHGGMMAGGTDNAINSGDARLCSSWPSCWPRQKSALAEPHTPVETRAGLARAALALLTDLDAPLERRPLERDRGTGPIPACTRRADRGRAADGQPWTGRGGLGRVDGWGD